MNDTCAPSKTFDNISCFTLESLKQMAKSYNNSNNKSNTDKIIISEDKQSLVDQLNNRITNCAGDQYCWLNQNFIKKLDSDEIHKHTFRPFGPRVGNEWLSNIDIVNVMNQYHKIYPKFLFLGAVPIDFDEQGLVSVDKVKNLLENKTQFGVVFNTDPSTGRGQHWNSLYCDFDKGQIYFFDSVGIEPLSQVRKFIAGLVELIYFRKYNEKLNIDKVIHHLKSKDDQNEDTKNQVSKLLKIDIRYNTTKHQQGNSECGVYSMNFILRLLKGESFDDITNTRNPDERVNQCRQVYFIEDKLKK